VACDGVTLLSSSSSTSLIKEIRENKRKMKENEIETQVHHLQF